MKILHIVPGLNDPTNGIAVAAKWIAESQRKSGHEVGLIDTSAFVATDKKGQTSFITSGSIQPLSSYAEFWVHSMWLPMTLRACRKVLQIRKRDRHCSSSHSSFVALVRMPHGCLDPVKIRYHFWKKFLVTPFDRWLMAKADRVIATEEDERRWISAWCPKAKVDMIDLGSTVGYTPRPGLGNRKFLFVGRMHPLKGFDILLAAIRAMKDEGTLPSDFSLTVIGKDEKGLHSGYERTAAGLPLRFLGEVTAEIKESEMASADCLVLPTLSENFALVVKESLEHGVPVITTDGAKIWKDHAGVTYIDHFVVASQLARIRMLRGALTRRMHIN